MWALSCEKRLELIVVVATGAFFCVHLVKEVNKEDRKEDCFFSYFFFSLLTYMVRNMNLFFGGAYL